MLCKRLTLTFTKLIEEIILLSPVDFKIILKVHWDVCKVLSPHRYATKPSIAKLRLCNNTHLHKAKLKHRKAKNGMEVESVCHGLIVSIIQYNRQQLLWLSCDIYNTQYNLCSIDFNSTTNGTLVEPLCKERY